MARPAAVRPGRPSLAVFVVLRSIAIAGPVVYYLLGGQTKTSLNELKGWLGAHNAAVMAVLFTSGWTVAGIEKDRARVY